MERPQSGAHLVASVPRPSGVKPFLRRPRAVLGLLLIVGAAFLVGVAATGGILIVTGDVGGATGKTYLLVTSVGGILGFAVGLWVGGVALLRGTPRTVLFLRKFGFEEATEIVGDAAERALGRRWRLVTLDDLETAPVGGGAAMRWTLWITGLGALAVLVGGTVAFVTAPEGDPIATGADQAFSNAVIAAAVVLFIGFALRSMRAATRAQMTAVATEAQLSRAVQDAQARRRRFFAPRLAVVRVAHDLWRQTVCDFAAFCDCVLVDASRPTDALLWEIRTVEDRFDARVVVVGEVERMKAVCAGDDPTDRTLLDLLGGRDVLVYDGGRGDFSSSLRNALDETVG